MCLGITLLVTVHNSKLLSTESKEMNRKVQIPQKLRNKDVKRDVFPACMSVYVWLSVHICVCVCVGGWVLSRPSRYKTLITSD